VLINGDSTNADVYQIASGATLSLEGGGVDNNGVGNPENNLSNTAKILDTGGGGTLNIGNITFIGDAFARMDVGTTNFTGGTYDFNNIASGATVINSGTFNSGTIGGAGPVEVTTN